MVKKFISAILGKKDGESKESAGTDEVPDELPPLAEDIVASISNTKLLQRKKLK